MGLSRRHPCQNMGCTIRRMPEQVSLAEYLRQRWQPQRPAVGVLFYRTHW